MTYKGKWPGTWATICDVCGFRFPSNKLSKRWDGLMTCREDWEARHPQDFIQIRQEKIAPDWVRPVAPDQFIPETGLLITEDGDILSSESNIFLTAE
jgi:hypothetical protein